MRTKPFLLVQKQASDLVPDGAYPARLVAVRQFGNAYGPRLGFEFELLDGDRAGDLVVASAAPTPSPKGRLAELLRGLLGREPSEHELADPAQTAGMRCRVLIRTESNKSGRTYSNVAAVFR